MNRIASSLMIIKVLKLPSLIIMQKQVLLIFWFEKLEFIRFKKFAQRGARTHDPEIKSLVLYRLS